MRLLALVLTILVALLLGGCGDSGGSANGTNGDTTTPEAGTPPLSEDAIPINVSVSQEGLDPVLFEIEAGKTYVFHFTNNDQRGRTLLVQRWGVDLFAPSGETTFSNTFTEAIPGEYLKCWERTSARKDEFKCTVVVK